MLISFNYVICLFRTRREIVQINVYIWFQRTIISNQSVVNWDWLSPLMVVVVFGSHLVEAFSLSYPEVGGKGGTIFKGPCLVWQ